MTTNRRSAGGSARGAPAARGWARPPGLALLALAVLSIVQGGCKSDGCSTCGGFFSRAATNVGNGVQSLGAKVFHHGDGASAGCSTCGGADQDGYIDSGAPVMIPGGMAVPAPTTVIPGPALEEPPTQLSPIPSTSTQPTSPSGTGSNSSRNVPGNTRSVYETSNPRNVTARSRIKVGEIARASISRPESVAPSADLVAESSDVLDRVPPVEAPVEINRKAPATDPATRPSSTPPAEDHSAAGAGVGSLSVPIVVAPKQAPGIVRSASVAPSIGGGSAPSIEGLNWLKEKGYKTFIDLRQRSEVEASYIDSVNDLGMVYISLPIVSDHLSASRMARFEELIAQSSYRPLYFCDIDGTRAGLVWYLHLRSVVGEDRDSASQKAEELGLTPETRKLADAFLADPRSSPKSVARRDLPRWGDAAPKGDPTGPSPAPPSAPAPAPAANSAPPVIPTPEPPLDLPADSPPAPTLPSENRPQASVPTPPTPIREAYREPSSWKSFAALVLTGLGVPLAYWSKNAIGESRIIRRASLPAAARRSLRGPAGSDA